MVSAKAAEPIPATRTGEKPGRRDGRLSQAGHLVLASAVVFLACSGLVIARREAQIRIQKLAYCHRETIERLPTKTRTASNLAALAQALPSATFLQRQRLTQQATELVALYRYHCRSMQIISANYQSLVSVANGSAMVSATMVALLRVHGLKGDIAWPFTVLVASAFTLGLALVSIQTFSLNDNLKTSRNLYEQTIALTRSFATSIANQQYTARGRTLSLLDRHELGLFISTIDQQLSSVDVPTFVMNGNFASKEARLLLKKTPPQRIPTPRGGERLISHQATQP